jgi:dihydroflavonol-4-reductase
MNLVTGATGLVGSHMVAELVRHGEKVRALYRSEQKKSNVQKILSLYFPGMEQRLETIGWVEGDVLDTWSLAAAMEGVSKVYHAAGIVSFGQVDKRTMMETNMQGTANVVNACLENPGTALCHVSSIAALGKTCGGNPIDESCTLKPDKKTPAYAFSKFKGELEVWRGINEGLRAVIVNPSIILGPALRNSSLRAVIDRINKRLSFYPSGTEGYIDIRDVTGIMYRLMNSDISGERFILNADNRSFQDLLTMIAKELGKKPPVYSITPWIGTVATAADLIRALVTGTPRQITLQALSIASAEIRYSNEKIVKQLSIGFIPVEESVKKMIEVYMQIKLMTGMQVMQDM